MPPGWGELLSNLPNLGGWVAFGVLAVLVILALIRGDLVPGYIHRREIARADEARQELNDERAKDEAAEAAARIAERAAAAVVRVQQLGRGLPGGSDEPH